jgi:hypothetical protein
LQLLTIADPLIYITSIVHSSASEQTAGDLRHDCQSKQSLLRTRPNWINTTQQHSHIMSEDSSNAKRLAELFDKAAGAITKKKLGYRQAMEVVGFTRDEIQNTAMYKRVIRRANALMTHERATASTPVPVPIVVLALNELAICSLTNGSLAYGSVATQGNVMVESTVMADGLTTPVKAKKHRCSVKELQHFNAMSNANNARKKQAMKVATIRI